MLVTLTVLVLLLTKLLVPVFSSGQGNQHSGQRSVLVSDRFCHCVDFNRKNFYRFVIKISKKIKLKYVFLVT